MKAIVVKYLPPTNRRGPRYKATDGDKNSLVVSEAHQFTTQGNKIRAAVLLCERMGWTTGLVSGGLPNGDEVFVFDNIVNHIPTRDWGYFTQK